MACPLNTLCKCHQLPRSISCILHLHAAVAIFWYQLHYTSCNFQYLLHSLQPGDTVR